HVNVAGSVDGNAGWIAEACGRTLPIDASLHSGRPGKGTDHTGWRDLADGVITTVRDVDVARVVGGYALRSRKARSCTDSIAASPPSGHSGEGSDPPGWCYLADRPVTIRNVDVAGTVGGDALREREARSRTDPVVASCHAGRPGESGDRAGWCYFADR